MVMNYMLPWKMDVTQIPTGKPVLVWQKGEEIPFMAIHKEGSPAGTVQMIEGTDPRGNGFYFSADQLECYLDVTA